MTFKSFKSDIVTIVEYLFVKIKSWIPTNWRKKIKKYKETHIEEFLVYDSHCWNCGKPIEAEKLYYKYGVFITSEWEGATKCHTCNYFICGTCGKCLYDSPMYNPQGIDRPRATLWVRMNDHRFRDTHRKVYETSVLDMYLDRLHGIKKLAQRFRANSQL